ncbi:hypothetical protein H2203_005822 [Taxawa tesnikishii (nom. ined.)]|nr:hypothetical protein H2203_005822 [Dothideales sp. JES 119]
MLVSLTVGKVDAGVAVLLTEDKRLIEFPSILLPPDISSGSIVDINVSRNFQSEQQAAERFAALQSEIYQTFGLNSPSAPVLRCRNATQTSVVLEWDPVNLATAELRSLSLYRNGSKAGSIPRDKLSTKISGLAIDTEYTFHLVLRTSAGTYSSEKLTVRTQKMTDLTGITITPGIMPAQLKDSLAETVERIGAKMIDTMRIDTTHFVCTEGRGQAWEKAMEMNVPVVVPDWVHGCEREGRIVGVRAYYLDADPKKPAGTCVTTARRAREESPRIEHTPPTPEQTRRPQTNGTEEPPTPPPKMKTPEPESAPAPEAPLSQSEETQPEAPAETTAGDESDESDATEKAGEPENNLKAVGIPHQPPEQADGAAAAASGGEGDEEGKFDEVAL